MASSGYLRITAVLVVLAAVAPEAAAQRSMITTRSPLQRNSSSFFERMGVGFGFNIRGARRLPSDDGGGSAVVGWARPGQFTPNGDLQFRQGGAGNVAPGIGGFTPGAGANFGFAVFGGGGGFFLNLNAAQGSRRGRSTISPSVTTLNGGQGFFFDGAQRPFVTSVIPVVGSLGTGGGYSPLRERMARLRAQGETLGGKSHRNSYRTPRRQPEKPVAPADRFESRLHDAQTSTAGRAAASLAEIRRQKKVASVDTQQHREALEYFSRGQKAESDGKTAVAKYYYKMAHRRAEGVLRQTLAARLRTLRTNEHVTQ